MEHTSVLMATLLSVIALMLTGQSLTPVNVFMLISFINVLRVSCSVLLAYGFLDTYDAYASLGRIEKFLLLENVPALSSHQVEDATSNSERNSAKLNGCSSFLQHQGEMEEDKEVCVDEIKALDRTATLFVSCLTYKQEKREDEFILQDIEFTASSESLTVITGPVGSGKSTLLSAIAGEVPEKNGHIRWKGTLVYVPQIAWVFSGTIRENILFGEQYDEAKYNRIIEACALTEDIKQFPECDQTVVGQRGEVLSGGQRARVSLARAIYADADLYLLDDPLSAVDFKVGQHIFEKCIKGLLGQKTRVVTSHQEQLMKEADNVIVLYKGRVLGQGTFTELKETGILNTTVDPLYKKLNINKSGNSFDKGNEVEDDAFDSCDRTVPLTNEAKGLQISEEDREIGVVSSKLYWNYFRSGMHPLLIVALFLLFLVTQGRSQS